MKLCVYISTTPVTMLRSQSVNMLPKWNASNAQWNEKLDRYLQTFYTWHFLYLILVLWKLINNQQPISMLFILFWTLVQDCIALHIEVGRVWLWTSLVIGWLLATYALHTVCLLPTQVNLSYKVMRSPLSTTHSHTTTAGYCLRGLPQNIYSSDLTYKCTCLACCRQTISTLYDV